jgi:predicted MFS family arabinose efflux permease
MFCVNDKAFRRLVARVLIFFLCAAALHALLPVIVSNPKMFGMSWSAFGLGAVLGAIVYPWLSSRLSLHTQLSTGIVFHALSLGALTVVTDETMRLFVLVFLGVCWFFVMSAAQVGAQLALPDSMRSRGMGAFVVVIIAGIGLGAPLWGMVARFFSAEVSLLTAMSVSLLSLVFTHHISVRDTR